MPSGFKIQKAIKIICDNEKLRLWFKFMWDEQGGQDFNGWGKLFTVENIKN